MDARAFHSKPVVSPEFIIVLFIIILGFFAFFSYRFFLPKILNDKQCNSDLDCLYIFKCQTVGPIVVGHPNKMCNVGQVFPN